MNVPSAEVRTGVNTSNASVSIRRVRTATFLQPRLFSPPRTQPSQLRPVLGHGVAALHWTRSSGQSVRCSGEYPTTNRRYPRLYVSSSLAPPKPTRAIHLIHASSLSPFLPHPYSFASRSHCVPLPEPGPPRTKTTGAFGFASAPAAASISISSPIGTPPTTEAPPPAVTSEATAETVIEGVECAPLRRPPQPPRRAAPSTTTLEDDDRSNAAARIALVVECAGRPAAAAPGDRTSPLRPQKDEMIAVADIRVCAPLPCGLVIVRPRKPPRAPDDDALALDAWTATGCCCSCSCRRDTRRAFVRQQSCTRAKLDLICTQLWERRRGCEFGCCHGGEPGE